MSFAAVNHIYVFNEVMTSWKLKACFEKVNIALWTSYCLCGFCVWSLYLNALQSLLSSFTINLMRKRERAGCFTSLSSWCFGTVRVVCFPMVQWVFL